MNLQLHRLTLTCLAAVAIACNTADGAAALQPAGPPWAWNLPVYETSLDLATPKGTFREFEQHLDALKDLGIGIIWFLPIFPRSGNPPDKPRSDSPYCVQDYYDVNSKHGTKEEFRHLVGAIHARGMYVIMDWVPNHTSWGNDLIKTHPEFYKKDKDGHIAQAGPWKDVAQLDYSNRNVWEYMYQARKYWITQFDVDGFREDVAGAVPLEHWQWLRPKLDALKPIFMLAEAELPRLHPAFDMTYDWTSQVNFYMIARGTWPASSLDRLLDAERQKFPTGAVRMRHLTNHDMAREQYAWDNRAHLDKSEYPFLEKTPLAEKYKRGDRAFAVLCATLPNSKPMVWNGQELGILAKTPKLQWHDSPYLRFYRKLLHTYRQNPALYQGEFRKIATSKPAAVYAFWRRAGQNRAVVVVNLTDHAQHVTLEPGESAGHYSEVFNAEDRVLTATAQLDLEPWACRVFLSGTPPAANRQAAVRGWMKAKKITAEIQRLELAPLSSSGLTSTFPGFVFYQLRLPEGAKPVGPLKGQNIFAVNGRGEVTLLPDKSAMIVFFQREMQPALDRKPAEAAVEAYLRLWTGFIKDRTLTFGDNLTGAGYEDAMTNMMRYRASGRLPAKDPQGADCGWLGVTLVLNTGRYEHCMEEPKLKLQKTGPGPVKAQAATGTEMSERPQR